MSDEQTKKITVITDVTITMPTDTVPGLLFQTAVIELPPGATVTSGEIKKIPIHS